MLKDTRFILVRAECPYVQFAAVAHVISTKRFVVGCTNGRERDMSQVSDGRNEWVPRARSLLGCVFVVWWIDRIRVPIDAMPFIERPAFSFIDQGKARVIVEGKEEDKKEKKSSRITGSFFSFTWVLPTL